MYSLFSYDKNVYKNATWVLSLQSFKEGVLLLISVPGGRVPQGER